MTNKTQDTVEREKIQVRLEENATTIACLIHGCDRDSMKYDPFKIEGDYYSICGRGLRDGQSGEVTFRVRRDSI